MKGCWKKYIYICMVNKRELNACVYSEFGSLRSSWVIFFMYLCKPWTAFNLFSTLGRSLVIFLLFLVMFVRKIIWRITLIKIY